MKQRFFFLFFFYRNLQIYGIMSKFITDVILVVSQSIVPIHARCFYTLFSSTNNITLQFFFQNCHLVLFNDYYCSLN